MSSNFLKELFRRNNWSREELMILMNNNLIRPLSKSCTSPQLSIKVQESAYKILPGFDVEDKVLTPCITALTQDMDYCKEDDKHEYHLTKDYRFTSEEEYSEKNFLKALFFFNSDNKYVIQNNNRNLVGGHC